jgi:hypothetical protein
MIPACMHRAPGFLFDLKPLKQGMHPRKAIVQLFVLLQIPLRFGKTLDFVLS